MHTPILASQHSSDQSASTQGPDQLIMGSLHVCKAILLQIQTELSKCANVPVQFFATVLWPVACLSRRPQVMLLCELDQALNQDASIQPA